MARTPPARKHGPFQEWLEKALDRRGVTLAELSRMVDADYSHLWKILRGAPAKYPTSARPGFDLAMAIGRELGDVEGALKAAGYDLPEEPAEEVERIRDDQREVVMHRYDGLPPAAQKVVRELLDQLYDANRDRPAD
jgi:hypothetical protein